MIKVLLVDDHPAIRMGIAAVFDGADDIVIAAQAASLAEAREVLGHVAIDVVVVDVRLADGDGIDLASELRHQGARVIVYSQYTNSQTVLRAFRAGVLGYVVKTSEPETLREGIRHVAGGQVFIDPQVADKVVMAATKTKPSRGPFGLTPQELAVVGLLPRGLTNQQIAEALKLSPETVKTHLRNAMPKLKVNDRAAAAALATEIGLG